MKRLLFLASFVVSSSALLQAQQVFNENFESFPTTQVQSPGTFGPWSVTVGSVDTLNSFAGVTCRGAGTACVDMDGSFSAAGTIQRTFAATAGTQYTLTFFYSGNQRGGAADNMTVSMGTSTVNLTNIPSGQAFTSGTLIWTAAATGNATVQFAHTGGDNVGMLLDDVILTAGSAGAPPTGIPTLSQWGMMGLVGLLLLFGVRRLNLNQAN